ncbi:hypothetical protein FQN57_002463 [Myotisia sp. PD_48]|nr:hypothetical protein FQN57_002463 [Myotisia sp. PD_48]
MPVQRATEILGSTAQKVGTIACVRQDRKPSKNQKLRNPASHPVQPVVRILLDSGANVNAQGGEYGNALQAASWEGHEGGGHALYAASFEGHEEVVQMLLDSGANVKLQYGNALYAASSEGHEKVVQILLDSGANVNAQYGKHGNALQAASSQGHDKLVQILLESGANVNVLSDKPT